ncbi:MAG: hypothetical protein CMJ52_10735 [Planctomycetaceae bacterium]|nr:hypothetical protein [Planctomycetaceae bacterium]
MLLLEALILDIGSEYLKTLMDLAEQQATVLPMHQLVDSTITVHIVVASMVFGFSQQRRKDGHQETEQERVDGVMARITSQLPLETLQHGTMKLELRLLKEAL